MDAITKLDLRMEQATERGFLVGLELKGMPGTLEVEDSLLELEQLARTAGIEVVGKTAQRLSRINPATYIGPGKVEELETWRRELEYEVLVFDEELSPRQQRNLEEALGAEVKVLDRTALILDIFAQHARTREGALQVELAQYEYRLPRLTRLWTHLARQAGGAAGRGGTGGVGLRGPGETQLEVDRRAVAHRIAHLRKELDEVRLQRSLHRQRRRKEGIPVIAIVGYTNAGKSTLFNAICGAEVLVEDKLFATLDPTTRRTLLPSGREVLFTDTVGFIQKLPTHLVASFRATLEELVEADVLLHVIDITHRNAFQQAEVVLKELGQLGASDRPVITVLNKVDLAEDLPALPAWLADALPVSARLGTGLAGLLTRLDEVLARELSEITAHIPYQANELVTILRRHGFVQAEEYSEAGIYVHGKIPQRLFHLFKPYVTAQTPKAEQSKETQEAG